MIKHGMLFFKKSVLLLSVLPLSALAAVTPTSPANKVIAPLVVEKAISQALLAPPKKPKARPPQSPVLIFISFSMPMQGLRQWLREGQRVHAPLVLRGFVHNQFLATAQKIHALLKNTKGGVMVDPMWFHRFHIHAVPAVVVRSQKGFDVVYGNVELETALKAIAQHGTAGKVIAQKLLKKYRAQPS